MTNSEAESQTNFVKRDGTKFVFKCIRCFKQFTSPGYEVRFGRMNKYCSNLCQSTSPFRQKNAKQALYLINRNGKSNSNWRGGVSRQQSYKFRKLFCELCRTTKTTIKRGFIAHHIDKNRRNNVMENIKTVCYSCHKRIHGKINFGKYPEFQKW